MFLLITALFGSATESDVPRSATECPRIFGSPSDRKANAAARAEWLASLTVDERSVHIVQFGDMKEPKRLSLNGLSVPSNADAPQPSSDGLIVLEPELAEKGQCAPGTYRVEPDDNLGTDSVVVAATSDLILVQRENELWFLIAEDGEEPRFFMSWEARFHLPRRYEVSPRSPMPQPPSKRR